MSILISTEQKCFILTGQINIFQDNPRIKRRFEANTFNAKFDDDKIIVSFSRDADDDSAPYYEDQYQSIINTLNKNNIEYELSKATQILLSSIEKENKNFEEFSKKAYLTRNGNVTKEDFSSFVKIIKEKLPGRRLYPLQERSAYHLAFSQNACNFSVPGAGKTSVVYAAYTYLKNLEQSDEKFVDRILVVCPLSAFDPWIDEYKECFNREPNFKKMRNINSMDRKKFFLSDKYTEITLISYQSISSNEQDIEAVINYLKNHKVMVVLDEAHRIKRVEGKWAEAILAISRYCSSRVILTGTPIPRGYQDLHNIYKFIWPTKNIIRFPLPHLLKMTEYNYPTLQDDVEDLTNDIAPFFIRVKKSDLSLAKVINHPCIKVNMTESQRFIHDYLYEDFMHDMDEKSNSTKRLISGRLIRLRQAATNPALLKEALDKYDNESRSADDSFLEEDELQRHIEACADINFIPPKFTKILDIINQIKKNDGADGKVIIWSVFISNILRLHNFLSDNGVTSEVLYGAIESEDPDDKSISDDTTSITRENIIRRFHSDIDLKVIIANPLVVGESISLHKACHNAIYLDKDYNAASYMQSKDRIHRVDNNTNYVVNYFHLISERSIDELIHDKICAREAKQLEMLETNEIPLLIKPNEDLITSDILKEYYDRRIKSNH
tara:strand:- start:2335 stop:4335 length:2001 start_codon:yes stop_codon:yes gene_type:complete